MRQARRCACGAVTPSRTAAYWIERLGLAPHPEGGHFRETYRAVESIPADGLPARFAGPRTFSTAVYYLLQGDDVSALHRIAADEVWHHYMGAPLVLAVIDAAGRLTTPVLGADAERGETFQLVVPAGAWFGAALARTAPEPDEASAFALVGCTVAPGFEFADLELGRRAELLRRYPQHRAVIERLTVP